MGRGGAPWSLNSSAVVFGAYSKEYRHLGYRMILRLIEIQMDWDKNVHLWGANRLPLILLRSTFIKLTNKKPHKASPSWVLFIFILGK